MVALVFIFLEKMRNLFVLFSLLSSLSLIAADMPQKKMITRYYNGRILLDHKLRVGELWVVDGKIVLPQPKADREVDVEGKIVAPGLIDLQINGGFGIDFASCPEGIDEVAQHLVRFGVTAFLPTLVSSQKNRYQKAFAYFKNRGEQDIRAQSRPFKEELAELSDNGNAKQSRLNLEEFPSFKEGVLRFSDRAQILGLHLEGPFLNLKGCGAHNQSNFCCLDTTMSIEDFYGCLDGVKIVTLAPELKGSIEAIRLLRDRGIVVSAGHSYASYDEMRLAFENGLTLVTHLFNAMAPFHHRDPSIVGFALTQPDIFYSLIVDGHHLHPAAVKLAWNANPKGLLLITDGCAALGLSQGKYKLGEKEIEVIDGAPFLLGTKTLAGSTVTLDQAVRNLYKYSGCTAAEALEAASLRPAQLLQIENEKGSLHEGADADFIFLDDELDVQACYIGGRLVWEKSL
jgi:N-acetylglucosamine-6-phosphate deacetylase